jgi:hypothetical protein
MRMAQPMARTTPRTRAEIHESQASLTEVSQTYNISLGTVGAQVAQSQRSP